MKQSDSFHYFLNIANEICHRLHNALREFRFIDIKMQGASVDKPLPCIWKVFGSNLDRAILFASAFSPETHRIAARETGRSVF
uniref:Uncharacterized protein n=1 Tax=Arion vulgaris TaxID=1028688 RepID=A0A0B7AC57_9EUPU